MNHWSTHYRSGEEIHLGDRITLDGRPGYVVFVLGFNEFPRESDAAGNDWYKKEYADGFMLDVQDNGWVLMNESDEDLEFVSRS